MNATLYLLVVSAWVTLILSARWPGLRDWSRWCGLAGLATCALGLRYGWLDADLVAGVLSLLIMREALGTPLRPDSRRT